MVIKKKINLGIASNQWNTYLKYQSWSRLVPQIHKYHRIFQKEKMWDFQQIITYKKTIKLKINPSNFFNHHFTQ